VAVLKLKLTANQKWGLIIGALISCLLLIEGVFVLINSNPIILSIKLKTYDLALDKICRSVVENKNVRNKDYKFFVSFAPWPRGNKYNVGFTRLNSNRGIYFNYFYLREDRYKKHIHIITAHEIGHHENPIGERMANNFAASIYGREAVIKFLKDLDYQDDRINLVLD